MLSLYVFELRHSEDGVKAHRGVVIEFLNKTVSNRVRDTKTHKNLDDSPKFDERPLDTRLELTKKKQSLK